MQRIQSSEVSVMAMTKRQMQLQQAKERLFVRTNIERQKEKIAAEQRKMRELRQKLKEMK